MEIAPVESGDFVTLKTDDLERILINRKLWVLYARAWEEQRGHRSD